MSIGKQVVSGGGMAILPVRPEPVEGPFFLSKKVKGFDNLSPNGGEASCPVVPLGNRFVTIMAE
ncbi:hypothetical protein MOK15_08260 [Sphingobium sp. BYY-5]|uniref:hypothetical protein n=1 Tax=Sphingobium sp. BYY-5 TaxID=2926400 RepID=UPI001FA72251|nr:hypothetical protein [Sphingobium sp. BYY-5]MCI4590087.1 hypothetical protein [Sphingobium sp. BYY-5]